MNLEAGKLFFMVFLGLMPILRGGRWRWDVLAHYGQPVLRSMFLHKLLLGMFWLGWFSELIVGFLVLFRAVPWAPRSHTEILKDPAWIAVFLIGMVVAMCSVCFFLRDSAARRSGLLPEPGRATMADVERLARSGHRFFAIRCYREIHHCGLAEAKNTIAELHFAAPP